MRQVAWRPRAIALATLLIFGSATGFSKENAKGIRPGSPLRRTDLGQAFSSAVCERKAGSLPFDAWAAGVYDAQIEGRFMNRRDGLPVDAERLEHKAKALALVRGLGGYSFGSCENGKRGWILALPAPHPVRVVAKGRLQMPVQDLAARCETYRVDFASSRSFEAKELQLERGIVDSLRLGDGVLSITCQPKMPRWRGPVLWFLVPTGIGPQRAAPESEALSAKVESLGPWINRIRGKAGLRPFSFPGRLKAQADILAVDGSVTHDRQLLKKVSDHLGNERVKLLGEDRVKGDSTEVMAWLLWNSPRHRALILNREATAAGLAIKEVGQEKLAVLITAREETSAVSQAPVSRSKGKVR